MRYPTLFTCGELPPGLRVGNELGGQRCKDAVVKVPEEVAPAGVAAGAREVDESVVLLEGLVANASVPVVAERHHINAGFRAMR